MDSLEEQYKSNKSWGLSTSIDLYGCNPSFIRNAEKIKQFVVELCDRTGMKRFGECQIVDFGSNDEVAGFSMTQLINSSLISAHFANKTNRIFLDVFSCKYYEPEEVAEFAKHFFEARDYVLKYTLRK